MCISHLILAVTQQWVEDVTLWKGLFSRVVVVHAWINSTWEAEAGGKKEKAFFKASNLSTGEVEAGRSWVRGLSGLQSEI